MSIKKYVWVCIFSPHMYICVFFLITALQQHNFNTFWKVGISSFLNVFSRILGCLPSQWQRATRGVAWVPTNKVAFPSGIMNQSWYIIGILWYCARPPRGCRGCQNKRGCVSSEKKVAFSNSHLESWTKVGTSSLMLCTSSSRLSRSSKLLSSLITEVLMASSTLVQFSEMGSMSSQKNLCSGGALLKLENRNDC